MRSGSPSPPADHRGDRSKPLAPRRGRRSRLTHNGTLVTPNSRSERRFDGVDERSGAEVEVGCRSAVAGEGRLPQFLLHPLGRAGWCRLEGERVTLLVGRDWRLGGLPPGSGPPDEKPAVPCAWAIRRLPGRTRWPCRRRQWRSAQGPRCCEPSSLVSPTRSPTSWTTNVIS